MPNLYGEEDNFLEGKNAFTSFKGLVELCHIQNALAPHVSFS